MTANLENSTFNYAFLFRVNFSRANLQGAIFAGAFIAHSNLKGANLKGANLLNVILTGARYTPATQVPRWFNSTDAAHGLILVDENGERLEPQPSPKQVTAP